MTAGIDIQAGEAMLRQAGVSNAAQEARWLSEAASDMVQYRRWLLRRCAGEPLQYVMGSAAFWDFELEVGPGVLVPRPETEQLVEIALSLLPQRECVCDVCTGSGAIAIALASSGKAEVWATELSSEALEYASRNTARYAEGLVHLYQGDLFKPLPGTLRFGLVTANPPYVSPEEYAVLPAEVRDYEPRLALEAAENGLLFYRRLAEESPAVLKGSGRVLCEIGETQGDAVAALFGRAGFRDVEIRRDYAGKERFLLACWPGRIGD